MKIYRHVIAFFYTLVLSLNTLLVCLPMYLLGLIKLIPCHCLQKFCRQRLDMFATLWFGFSRFVILRFFPTKWKINMPDDLSTDEWYVILCNHQSWLDIAILLVIFQKKTPYLKYFIKQQLKWVPVLGLIWLILDYPFLTRQNKKTLHKQHRNSDSKKTNRFAKVFKTLPSSVVNFIEGTRFTEEKKMRSRSPYQHLLKPRLGSLTTLLDSLPQHPYKILDVTICYPKGIQSFWEFLGGNLDTVSVEVKDRSYLKDALKPDHTNNLQAKQSFRQHVNEIWKEKDNTLSSLIEQAKSSFSR